MIKWKDIARIMGYNKCILSATLWKIIGAEEVGLKPEDDFERR